MDSANEQTMTVLQTRGRQATGKRNTAQAGAAARHAGIGKYSSNLPG